MSYDRDLHPNPDLIAKFQRAMANPLEGDFDAMRPTRKRRYVGANLPGPPITKRHRAYYGGDKKRQIERGAPNGRCLHQRQDGDYITYLHPGRGWQVRLIKEAWWKPSKDRTALKARPSLIQRIARRLRKAR